MNRYPLWALVAAPVLAIAAEPTPLQPVIVTATGTEVAQTDVLASTVVITRQDIERSAANDLADLLRFHAGLDIGRAGGPGQQTSVFVRGGESNHTLVLVDGVRVNPGSAGGAALQHIAPDMIERIEVVKGPRATLYGSDAVAAVINVITRGAERSRYEATLRGGRFRTAEGGALGAWRGRHGGASLQAQHVDTDGFPTLADSELDRGYRRSTVNASADSRRGPVTLSARGWHAGSNVQYSAFDGSPRDQDTRNQAFTLAAAVDTAADVHADAALSYMTDDIRQNQNPDFARTRRAALNLGGVWTRGVHRLSAGAMLAREDVDFESFGRAGNERRDIVAMRLQDELIAGRHRAVLAAAWTDHDAFGDRVTGNLEYGFDIFANARVVASAGTGFRAPDASDRFGFGGNPDLRPERARSAELGWQQRFGSAQRVDLRLFASRVDDLISVEFDPGADPDMDFGFRAVNVDRSRNRGVELEYRVVAGAWQLGAGGIVQRPEDRGDGSPLLRRARRSLTLRAAYDPGTWFVAANVLGTSRRPDFDTELPGYTLVNAAAGLRIGPMLRLQAEVENLLDKDYQTAAGFNQPERALYVTLRYGG